MVICVRVYYIMIRFLFRANRSEAAETGLDPVRLRRFAAGFGILKCYADNNISVYTIHIILIRFVYCAQIYAIIRCRALFFVCHCFGSPLVRACNYLEKKIM